MSATKIITYPFPLRGVDFLARFELPDDLTHVEALRVCAFIMTLPVDEATTDQKGAEG